MLKIEYVLGTVTLEIMFIIFWEQWSLSPSILNGLQFSQDKPNLFQ